MIFKSKPDKAPDVKKNRLTRFTEDLWTPSAETKEDDLFLVGFPKSGNTWLRFLMTGLYYKMDMSVKSGRMVGDLIPDLQQFDHYMRYLDRMCFKTHSMPEERFRNVVYIHRDGRDALCSLHAMKTNMGKESNLRDWISEKSLFHGFRWSEHVEAWLENPFQANIVYVSFDDLKNQPEETLQKICQQFGITFSEAHLKSVIENCSFQSMKDASISNPGIIHRYTKEKGSFMRKGASGSFAEDLSEDLVKAFTERNSETLGKLGYLN